MARKQRTFSTVEIALTSATVVAIVVILWLDIRTTFWQDLVIVGGIAAGIVTFVLTVIVLDKVLARKTHKRWEPIARLAITEILHGLADEEHSHITRGHIVPRSLNFNVSEDTFREDLHRLRVAVVEERKNLSQALGTWTTFLASSTDHSDILVLAADVAQHLDEVRELSLIAEDDPTRDRILALKQHAEKCDAQLSALTRALSERLQEMNQARAQSA